jgi:hypothetical protein
MKFPRTRHFWFSPGAGSGDKIGTEYGMSGQFRNKTLVMTEKLDGENQFWSADEFHLRSESSTGGAIRSRAKSKWAEVKHLLPENIGVFVEDISNIHSIQYLDYSDTFYVIRAVNTKFNLYYDHEFTRYIANKIGLPSVPFIKEFKADTASGLKAAVMEEVYKPSLLGGEREGVVVTCEFNHTNGTIPELPVWTDYTGKWVRENHVRTDEHWSHNPKDFKDIE